MNISHAYTHIHTLINIYTLLDRGRKEERIGEIVKHRIKSIWTINKREAK